MKKQTISILIFLFIILTASCSEADFLAPFESSTDIDTATETPHDMDMVSSVEDNYDKLSEENNYETPPVEYYYYNILNESKQQIYNTILRGFMQEKEEIRINLTDTADMDEIVNMVMNDHPELFYLNTQKGYLYTIYDGYIILKPCYSYAGKKRIKKQEEIEEASKKIIEDISILPTEYDKIKAVFEYIIDSTKYKVNARDNQNIYSVLVNKKSVCAGYARTTQYLLQKLGIETIYVTGTVYNRGNHAWNIVKCDGRYYQLDTTFGDMEFKDQSKTDIPESMKYCYDYLCCTDKQIYRDRKSDNHAKLPKCDSEDLDYYVLNGTYFKKYSNKVIKNMIKSICSGELHWSSRFKIKREYRKCLKKVEAGIYSDKVLKYLNGKSKVTTWYIYDEDMYTITCWYSI